jgi:VCBS repeat-containing protein
MPSQNGAQVGKVVTVSGEVTAEATGGGRVLTVDSPVFQDDVLITEQGERIEVLFSDGTRLAQGENSRLQIDSYVFDSAAPDASSMLLNAAEGTFRTITGKIAAENPENFTIKTPLATLGIRGTTVLSHITPDHEIHGPEFIDEGKAFVLTDNFGNIRFITDYVPVKVIDVRPDEPAGFQRILTQGEFLFFEEQVPMTTPEGEESTEGETGAILAAAAAGGVEGLFGPGTQDTPAWGDTIGVPQLFGPEGLPPLKAPAIDIVPPSMEPTPAPEQARDLLNGIIEDSSHNNNPPIARDMFGAIDEDHALSGVLDGSDPDGDPLAYSVVANPEHGTVTVNADGSYSYQPDANYFGPDSFAYQVTDPYGETSSALVSIQVNPVNDAPVANDGTYQTQQNQPLNGQLFGYDVDGDPLHFSVSANPAHGTITINPDGSFTYTPEPGFSGTDSFQFLLSDGQGGFDIGQGVIVVETGPSPITGPPVATDQTFTAVQGTTLTDQLVATDPDGDPLTYSLLTSPAFGTVSLNPDGSFSYSTTNNLLDENYGTVTFQYLVEDGQGGQDIGTVTITVSANYTGDDFDNSPKSGTALNDIFDGGFGNDTIDGAGGNDTITGNLGNDNLTGGPGSDTFVYNSVNDGYDTITDFATGTDNLHISGTLPGTVVLTVASPGIYGGTTAGAGPAIILHHNTTLNVWQVIYDPSIATVTYTTTGVSPSEVYIATLGSNPIDSGDVVLG